MIPVEWVVFLIPFVATLLKVMWEGRTAKTSLVFMLLLIVASTVTGVVLVFVDALLMQTTFALTMKDLITYLFNAFIGAIIIPLARYIISVKIE